MDMCDAAAFFSALTVGAPPKSVVSRYFFLVYGLYLGSPLKILMAGTCITLYVLASSLFASRSTEACGAAALAGNLCGRSAPLRRGRRH